MFSDDSPFSMWFWPAFWVGFWYFVVFGYGAIVGSFLNVIIYRLPLVKPGESPLEKINGKSYCPNCNTYLKPYHNVPLFGFLFLKGRCAYCKTPISWRYFAVELLTGCAWVALYNRVATGVGITWVDFVLQALFISVLIAMVFIDLDHFIAPDELNVVGFILGLVRDVACFALAWYIGTNMGQPYLLQEFGPRYFYFGWLPKALVGALVYGSILFAVSFFGFIYYAKGERESLASVTRRFFTFEDLPEEMMTDAEKAQLEEMKREAEAEAKDPTPPPRLRFSPGFLAVLSALLLFPSLGWFAVLAFVVPLAGFFAISGSGQDAGTVFRRFFSSNDLAPPPEHKTVDVNPVEVGSVTLTAQEEADQFAKEAESGKFGGMGLGDVKLALAIGAMLGPGLAVLSLFFATLFGAVVGIIFTRAHRKSLRYGVPFVPFMAAGAIVVMLFGSAFVDWYLSYSGMKKKPETSQTPARMIPADRPATPDPYAPYMDK